MSDGQPRPDNYDEMQENPWYEKAIEHVEITDGHTVIQIHRADYFKLMEKLVLHHDIPHKKHKK